MRLNRILVANYTPIFLDNKITGAVSVFQNITVEKQLVSQMTDIEEFVKLLELILDNVYVGIIFVDANGTIRFMNKVYEELLEVKRSSTIGKHITEFFPDSRLPLVMKSGKPELGRKYNFRGKTTLIVNRIPIRKGEQTVGGLTQVIFKDISELRDLASKLQVLETKVRLYRKELASLLTAKYTFDDIIGKSESIMELKKLALLYARADSAILIIGDTGTGKELFAHSIHAASSRAMGPFVSINSASLPKELVESELFGYAPGAFTGAHQKGRIGKIEISKGGTLFLDEIGDLPLSAQAKLLRVLDEKRVEKIGETYPLEVDFRLIAVTNKHIEQMVKEEKFRADLYYRMETMTLSIPTLKSRAEDIPLLVNHFLQKYSSDKLKVTDRALGALMKYHWQGNIRELKSVVERAISLLDENDTLDIAHLPSRIIKETCGRQLDTKAPKLILKRVVSEQEENTIRAALRLYNGNKVQAAKALGISRSLLYSKIKRYGALLE